MTTTPSHPVPTSPQRRDPPGKPADVHGIDLTASEKPDVQPTAPHLPHERDQDARMTDGEPDAQVQQGFRDLERGLEDTDQGLRSHNVGRKPKP